MKYIIPVWRTEIRRADIEVEAGSRDEAVSLALDKAGDIDFRSEGTHVDVEYSEEVV